MLSPQGAAPAQASPAMPNFQAGNQAQAAATAQAGAKPAKPVVHGLVTGEEIDERIATLPRSAQQTFVQAVSQIPNLADIFGIVIGPEAHDYIAQVADAIQQKNSPTPPAQPGGLSNSPSAPQDASASPTTSATPPQPGGLAPAGV